MTDKPECAPSAFIMAFGICAESGGMLGPCPDASGRPGYQATGGPAGRIRYAWRVLVQILAIGQVIDYVSCPAVVLHPTDRPPDISAPRDPAKVVKSAYEMQGNAFLTFRRNSIVPGVPVLIVEVTMINSTLSWCGSLEVTASTLSTTLSKSLITEARPVIYAIVRLKVRIDIVLQPPSHAAIDLGVRYPGHTRVEADPEQTRGAQGSVFYCGLESLSNIIIGPGRALRPN